MTLGDRLPHVPVTPPGPESRRLADRLRRVESRNITPGGDNAPIFWAEAAGANVRDADGNVYVDLTAGFGVAAAGHSNPTVVRAISHQAARLAHALGDVHPAAAKVDLLEKLAALAPGDLEVGILSANGADAVESALKTAALATGRPGVVAFEGAYHGLGLGALAVTHSPRFRAPFERQLYAGARFAPFPDPDRGIGADTALDAVREAVSRAAAGPDAVGAVIVEPVQGRGGIVVPPPDFLPRLRRLCTEMDLLLIADEVYTGFGRTGRWFACQHGDVVPDLLVVGKSLGGGLPISAVLGARSLMDAWPPSTGEAIHTSTFLGNPVTCAAALAHIRAIEEGRLVERAETLGATLRDRLDRWVTEGLARSARGLGLMRAAVPAGPDPDRRSADVARAALGEGILILAEGPALAFVPPLVITGEQLDHALDVIERLLARAL